ERNSEVLNRVMLVHVQIAGGLDRQVERAVPSEQLEHMVQKSHAGADGIGPLPVEAECQRDLRFGGLAVDYGAAHTTSSSTVMNRCVCSTTPAATRRQPSHPASVDRSRR